MLYLTSVTYLPAPCDRRNNSSVTVRDDPAVQPGHATPKCLGSIVCDICCGEGCSALLLVVPSALLHMGVLEEQGLQPAWCVQSGADARCRWGPGAATA